MRQLKNVLIIEDDSSLRNRYERDLKWKVNLFFAWSLLEAQNMVRKRLWELDIISFDLFLAFEEEDNEPKDTISLIEETKAAGFCWDMIASSDTEIYRKDQCAAGCNQNSPIKRNLAEFIMNLIWE
jgi:hypothetical protein